MLQRNISVYSAAHFYTSKYLDSKMKYKKKKALAYASKIGFCSFVSGAGVTGMGFSKTQSSLVLGLFRNLTHPIYIGFQWCFQ